MQNNVITPQDVQFTLYLIDKAAISGKESDAVTVLKNKFKTALMALDKPEAPVEAAKVEENTEEKLAS